VSIAALIPARGGSRALPWKNLAKVGGRSLVQRAIETARAVPEIEEIVVSSEAEEILDHAGDCGATPLRRPEELARDAAPMRDVVRHFLDEYPESGTLVLLQPTSPLRRPEDVSRCLDALAAAPSAVTLAPVEHPIEWFFRISDEGLVDPVFGRNRVVARRQDSDAVYVLNGAVFAARCDHLRRGGWFTDEGTVGIVMPRARSIDVDDSLDLAVVRLIDESAAEGGGE